MGERLEFNTRTGHAVPDTAAASKPDLSARTSYGAGMPIEKIDHRIARIGRYNASEAVTTEAPNVDISILLDIQNPASYYLL